VLTGSTSTQICLETVRRNTHDSNYLFSHSIQHSNLLNVRNKENKNLSLIRGKLRCRIRNFNMEQHQNIKTHIPTLQGKRQRKRNWFPNISELGKQADCWKVNGKEKKNWSNTFMMSGKEWLKTLKKLLTRLIGNVKEIPTFYKRFIVKAAIKRRA
jgi:hypothetical protein